MRHRVIHIMEHQLIVRRTTITVIRGDSRHRSRSRMSTSNGGDMSLMGSSMTVAGGVEVIVTVSMRTSNVGDRGHIGRVRVNRRLGGSAALEEEEEEGLRMNIHPPRVINNKRHHRRLNLTTPRG